jgi:apolipoprotein N-acyltransferase
MSPVSRPRRWALPALSGLLLGIAYLPGPFLVLNLTAFVPLCGWLAAERARPPLARFQAGFVFGLVAYLIAFHFMYSMLAFSWLAVLLYVGMTLAIAVRVGLEVALLGWLRERTGRPFSLLLPVVWIAFEWAQSWGELKMTGEHLAHTVAGYPFLLQFADLVGHYGVGAVLLGINGLVFETIEGWGRPAGRRAGTVLALLVVAILGYDAWAWTRPPAVEGNVRVGIVQPNVPIRVKHDPAADDEQARTLSELSRRAAERGAELIVWPESARPKPLYHWLDRPDTFAMADVQDLARELDAAFLVGVEYVRLRSREDYELYNAAVAVDAQGRMLDRWGAKVYLVPFTEGVPFQRLLNPLVQGRGGHWRWLAGGFDPGRESALIDVAGARVGVLVCYEQLFPDLARQLRRRGAELQVVITNDAWWARSLFQQYQANALRLRAIENRTAYVRAANTGIYLLVEPY